MKRIVCLILVISWAFCLLACMPQENDIQDPVRFYYPRSKITYGNEDSVISWEEQEAAGHRDEYMYLLRQYLKGPVSDSLSRTFPRSVMLKDLQITGSTAHVVLNDYAALVTGLDLTIACACLAATAIELTGVQRVTIQAEHELLDGNPFITMDREHILLLDESAARMVN